ncbi:PTS mannose transporter subunit IID [Granulicatella seriolae]|uniref:PTS mannose transporter subunit IID n=1 Tax=Granulicatella seriolae TaxID=2967226 RepID=A0ABT1WMA5_9LACT|nr:PTS mannose transporter subunit IID [Granulicatella seriolae]
MTEVKLTKQDINKAIVRSNFLQGSWNFERMQNLGYAFQMLPIIEKLYPEGSPERIAALQRHLEFYNTQPFMTAPILGVTIAMEEQRANGAPIDDAAINGVKVGMMGPLAGVGDPIFWATLRPVLGALGASFALTGSIIGPLIFFFGFNIVRLLFRYFGVTLGYQKGVEVVSDFGNNFLQKLTEGASILGLFIIGVLVPRWTTVYFPTVVSRITQQDGTEVVTRLQDIFNMLIPGLVPLLLTFACMHLLKKKVSPLRLIFILFAVGIIGYVIGLLGFPA